MSEENTNPVVDTNELIAQRQTKLKGLREQGQVFVNDFDRENLAADIHQHYDALDNEQLEAEPIAVSLAGRMMTRRIMGKASFIHLQDMSGRIQIYVKRDELPEGVYAQFKKWDLGDIVGVKGFVFKTKTGETSIKATEIRLLTKAIRPLPDKYHGLIDQEACYRQRYLDLIANEETRKRFIARSQIITSLRNFLSQRRFLEVETPMMQAIAGGANAKPFTTYHNALDMPLFLRIAPELYLKRLVVGGFERVFEINRNFRNEGLSTRHNPEFTMLEFYQAYADYEDLMDLTEEMIREVAIQVTGSSMISYQGENYDLSQPFQRLSVCDAILHYNPDITLDDLSDLASAKKIATSLGIQLKDSYGLGKVQIEIFEKTVEDKLKQPTFITEYPAEVSPLSRKNDDNPFIVDRFEFFIAGRELANGFSELNDPEDQAERFKKQMQDKIAGDDEAMPYDTDYITALEHGMPPTAGEGIGIDRLAMFLTDSPSIRDVILFPHMRALES